MNFVRLSDAKSKKIGLYLWATCTPKKPCYQADFGRDARGVYFTAELNVMRIRLTTLRYPLRVLCEKNFAHFVVKQERELCRAQRTHKVRKGELYLTSPCRCATSLSLRKARDICVSR